MIYNKCYIKEETMSPKTQYDKQAIINAAFELAQKYGLSSITTRDVAKKIGCSVAPIYVNFESVEDLKDAVLQKVFEISSELLNAFNESSNFTRIGKASLAFAKQYPVIFRELTMTPNKYMQSYDVIEKLLLEGMSEDDDLKDWSLKERQRLLFKMRTFHLGLSMMIATNQIPLWLDEDETENLLIEVGNELLKK